MTYVWVRATVHLPGLAPGEVARLSLNNPRVRGHIAATFLKVVDADEAAELDRIHLPQSKGEE